MSYEKNPLNGDRPNESQKDLKEAAERRGDAEMEELVRKAYAWKKN